MRGKEQNPRIVKCRGYSEEGRWERKKFGRSVGGGFQRRDFQIGPGRTQGSESTEGSRSTCFQRR